MIVSISIDKDVLAELDEHCHDTGISRSQLLVKGAVALMKKQKDDETHQYVREDDGADDVVLSQDKVIVACDFCSERAMGRYSVKVFDEDKKEIVEKVKSLCLEHLRKMGEEQMDVNLLEEYPDDVL